MSRFAFFLWVMAGPFIFPDPFHVFVQDEASNPLQKVSVQLPGKAVAQPTETRGLYRLAGRPEIDDVLVVTLPGFSPLTLAMNTVGPTNRIDLTLKRPQHRRLNEVTVNGDNRGGGARMVAADDLRRSSQLNWGDAARTLQALPGVMSTGNSFDSRMYIQGGSDQEWVGMLDHVVLFNPVRWNGAVSMFNPKVLENVSLYMAGFPASYGQGLSGVLVADTLEPSRDGWHGMLAFDAGFEGLLTGPLGTKASLLVSARRTWLDGAINLSHKEPGFRFPYLADALVKLQWRPAGRTRVELLAYGCIEGMDMPGGPGIQTSDVNETNRAIQFDYLDLNGILSLSLNQGFGRESDLSLAASILPRRNSNALAASSLVNFDNDNSSLAWQASATLHLNEWEGQRITLGALAVPYQSEINLTSRMSYLGAGGTWTNDTAVVSNSKRNFYGRAFIQDAITFLPGLTLTPGFGGAWLESTGEWVWEPRGDLTWKPSPAFQAFVRGGLYHAQEFDNVTLRRSPSALPAPVARHLAAGYQFTGKGWLFSGEGFYKNYTGLLEATPNQGLTNTGDRIVYGAGLFLRKHRGGEEPFGGYVSYTFTHGEETVTARTAGSSFEALPTVGEAFTPSFIRTHSISSSIEVLPLVWWKKAPDPIRLLEVLVDGRLQSGNPITSVTNVLRHEIPGTGYRYQLLYDGYNRDQNPLVTGLDVKITFPMKKNLRTFFTMVNLLGAAKVIDTVYQVKDTPPAGSPTFYQTVALGKAAVVALPVKDQGGAIQFRGGVSWEF